VSIFSGKMSNRFVDDVKSERRRATEELAKFKIKAVDPAAAEDKLWPKGKKAKISSTFKRKIMEAMVLHDLWLIRRCDVMFVLTGDVVSEGTLLEWRYAQSIGIPVVMVAPERIKGNFMGWVNILIPQDHMFPDLRSAARFIHKKYAKEYAEHHEYFAAAIKNRGKKKG
jgi:Domain of unknown function (DUF4406)